MSVFTRISDRGLDIAPGSLKQYVNAYRREHGTGPMMTLAKRSRKKAKKKKSGTKATNGAGRSAVPVAAGKASQDVEALKTSNSVENRVRKAPDRAPDGFLEMAEDL